MMRWYGGGMSGGAWFVMGLFWLLLIGVIVWLVGRLLPANGSATPTPPGPHRETPEEILDRRFALGELDLETYQAQRAALVAARGGRS